MKPLPPIPKTNIQLSGAQMLSLPLAKDHIDVSTPMLIHQQDHYKFFWFRLLMVQVLLSSTGICFWFALEGDVVEALFIVVGIDTAVHHRIHLSVHGRVDT